VSSLEFHLKKDSFQLKNEQIQKDDGLRLLDEDEASISSDGESRFVNAVKTNLQRTADADKQLARQKLTEQRIKKKRRLRERQGRYDDDEEGVIAVLGGADSDSGNG
jgi:hypothetical protein